MILQEIHGTKDIVVDPNDATQNTWYAAVFSGWGGPPNGLGGLYKTTNRGTSWTKLTGSTLDRVTSCTFNPNNPNEIFLTTETQGLWMSSNINAGSPTFSLVNSYPFRQPERVFFNPYNSNEMWVSSFGNGMKMGLLNPLGIPQFSEEQHELSFYPNPAASSFTISAKQGDAFSLFNMFGEKIMTEELTAGENTIDVSGFAEGMYIVQVNDKMGKILVRR
jgi:hypothetical protein